MKLFNRGHQKLIDKDKADGIGFEYDWLCYQIKNEINNKDTYQLESGDAFIVLENIIS